MRFDISSFIVGAGTYIVSQTKYVNILLNFFLDDILQRIVFTQKTSTSKVVSDVNIHSFKFHLKYVDYSSDDDVVSAIKSEISLKHCGVNEDCARIISIILREKSEFMTSYMDFIVISEMGFELVALQMPGKGHDRSGFVDLVEYRSSLLNRHRCLSILLTFGAMMIASNADCRAAVVKLFGQ